MAVALRGPYCARPPQDDGSSDPTLCHHTLERPRCYSHRPYVIQRAGCSCFAASVSALTIGSQAMIVLRFLFFAFIGLLSMVRRRGASATGNRITTDVFFRLPI